MEHFSELRVILCSGATLIFSLCCSNFSKCAAKASTLLFPWFTDLFPFLHTYIWFSFWCFETGWPWTLWVIITKEAFNPWPSCPTSQVLELQACASTSSSAYPYWYDLGSLCMHILMNVLCVPLERIKVSTCTKYPWPGPVWLHT